MDINTLDASTTLLDILFSVSARFFESTRHSGATDGDVPFGSPIIGISGTAQTKAHLTDQQLLQAQVKDSKT